MRVECFVVNCLDLKATIEGHLKSFADGLTSSVRKSAEGNLTELSEFLTGT